MCQTEQKTTESKEQIPTILRPWIKLYRSTPKLNIPGTQVDFAFSLRCAVLFSIIRLSARYLLYSLGWPHGHLDTYFTSACIASVCHSTMILPALAALLLSQKYVPSGKLTTSPIWYQDGVSSVMGFCTGYMIYDSILGYIIETWQPGVGPVLTGDDYSYLGHHILTTLYMISARWKQAGHMSAMMLMFNGEFSAPVMNVHLMLEKALEQQCMMEKFGSWLPMAFAYNEQLFAYLYLVCRVAVSPLVIGYVSYDLLFTKRGRANVPLWLSICWMPMCWGVQFGSIPWIMSCIETVKRGVVMNAAAADGGHSEL